MAESKNTIWFWIGLGALALLMDISRKHKPSEPSPAKKKNAGRDEPSKCHVYVEPGVQIDLVEDFKKRYETAQSDSTTHNTKQLFWTKVASVLLLLTGLFTGWQVIIAKQTFDSTVRPYVGEETIIVMYFSNNPDGTIKQSASWTPDSIAMKLRIPIKNFGPIPATGFAAHWKILSGGTEIKPVEELPSFPGTLYPGQEVYFDGGSGGQDFKDLMNGKTLVIQTTIEYNSPKGHEKDCQEKQFVPHSAFAILGECK